MELSIKKQFSAIKEDAETALENLSMARLENEETFNSLRDEITSLLDNAKSSIRMLDDLIVAKTSLETVGYSKEWFDIVNKDGKFASVVRLEMPKFFGGNEAKGKACMEGLIETLKSWAKTAWDWIVKAYNAIRETIHFIYEKIFKQYDKICGGDGKAITDVVIRVQSVFSNKVKYAAAYDALMETELEIHDPTIVELWVATYGAFLNMYGRGAMPEEDLHNATRTGGIDMTKTVDEKIYESLMKLGVSPDAKKSGIRCVGGEITMLSVTDIPKVTIKQSLPNINDIAELLAKNIANIRVQREDIMKVDARISQKIKDTKHILDCLGPAVTNVALVSVQMSMLQRYLTVIGRILVSSKNLVSALTTDNTRFLDLLQKIDDIKAKIDAEEAKSKK